MDADEGRVSVKLGDMRDFAEQLIASGRYLSMEMSSRTPCTGCVSVDPGPRLVAGQA